jgi:hypothetical protein
MATITSPEMLVAICSQSLGPPRRISFRFSKPYPPLLYLGTLTITEDATITGITGTIIPGSPVQAGTCALRMGTALFGPLFSYVSSHTGLEVELVYDDLTFAVSDLICSSTQPQLATEATVQAIQTTLGTGDISHQLANLNHTAKELLQSITRLTGLLSIQQKQRETEPPQSEDSMPAPRLGSAEKLPDA